MIETIGIEGSFFTYNKTAELCAEELFGDDNINWRYCKENATFHHIDACEFILHCYPNCSPDADEDSAFSNVIKEMTDYGCTQDFIDVYRAARNYGATRLLLYV